MRGSPLRGKNHVKLSFHQPPAAAVHTLCKNLGRNALISVECCPGAGGTGFAFRSCSGGLRRIFPRVFPLKKILIVDDEFLIRYSLAHMLQSASADVTTVASGAEAIREIQSLAFDLCCLDIHLPDGNGVDIMKRIRQLSPGTCILMMTGGEVTREMLSDILSQSGLLLSKPFDLFKVKNLVNCLLAGGNPAACTVVHDDGAGLGLGLKSNQRKYERQQRSVPDPCSVAAPGLIRTASVINVSREGLCLLTKYPLHTGSTLRIARDDENACIGTVRWSASEGNEEGYRAGIQFLPAEPGSHGAAQGA
ncbi:MAG: hypothetical protein A2078_02675 [Nitrospirae bacterium GWC2_57_9]|nr:MAG: hypothetical protein A2078_02675 [Nitrospirae bacterium GWC2_57_9]